MSIISFARSSRWFVGRLRIIVYQFALNWPMNLPLVSANLSQLQQVIVNLVTNAIEAMHGVADRYRVLRIKTKIYDTRYLLITVEDSGIGIDPKDRDSILEPFVTTKSNRMGMGLSICWSIIANHGGRLAVAPGQPQGSIFQVFLPL